MSAELVQEIMRQVEKLSTRDQLEILDDLVRRAAQREPPSGTRSILELEGLGKEIWDGIDAQEYVRSERESWNG